MRTNLEISSSFDLIITTSIMETESRQAIELERIEADSRENRVGQQDLDHIIAFSTLHKHFSGTHMAVRVSVLVFCWVIINLASQYQLKGHYKGVITRSASRPWKPDPI